MIDLQYMKVTYIWTADLSTTLTSLLRFEMQIKPEIFRPGQDLNPDLCDTGAVLDQLSYLANWRESFITWVHDTSNKMEIDVQCMHKSQITLN